MNMLKGAKGAAILAKADRVSRRSVAAVLLALGLVWTSALLASNARAQQTRHRSGTCRVPNLVGLDRAFAEEAVNADPNADCEGKLEFGHISIRRMRRLGRLIVVSQTPRAGSSADRLQRVSVELERVPQVPPHGTCRVPAFDRPVVRSSQLLMWEVTLGAPDESTETYYACTRPHGPTRVVDRASENLGGGESVEHLTSAGPFVGFCLSYGSKQGGGASVQTYDVLSGRTTFAITADSYFSGYAGGAGPQLLPELETLGRPVGRGVHGLVLNVHDDVAWLGETEQSTGQPSDVVLYLHDAHGTRMIEASRAISKLALNGPLLTWESEGKGKSSPS
jgi:hypothetical protein